jgi:hypothetical protein
LSANLPNAPTRNPDFKTYLWPAPQVIQRIYGSKSAMGRLAAITRISQSIVKLLSWNRISLWGVFFSFIDFLHVFW